MLIKVSNIKMPLSFGLDNDPDKLTIAVAKKLGLKKCDIDEATLLKRSVDARKKSDVCFVCSVLALVDEKKLEKIKQDNPSLFSLASESEYDSYKILKGININAGSRDEKQIQDQVQKPKQNTKHITSNAKPILSSSKLEKRPIIIGSGPAGLFAALTLVESEIYPIVIERGEGVDDRIKKIEKFNKQAILDPQTNIQFGEGGAGTFSDGKLTTQINDPLGRVVLNTFVKYGAPKEILWSAKPHIGTDLLPNIIKSIRRSLENAGVAIFFSTQLEDISIKSEPKISDQNLKLENITMKLSDGQRLTVDTDELILATGHSARDTYEMLNDRGLLMQAKAFSMGVRIEHRQSEINKAQYGRFAGHPALGSADYKLAHQLKNGRGVYTFCMCPGGDVVAASSEKNRICTNGMSRFARDGLNSNSALLVSVNPSDFESDDVLSGIEFQRKWEGAAFELGGGNYKAPAQLVGDFLKNQKSCAAGDIKPSYPIGVNFGKIDSALPSFVTESLREALPYFGKKIAGFDLKDAVLTAIEARSSSPVRLNRDASMQSNIRGIYPCGEGSGYAGGIMSSAIDGIRCAKSLIKNRNARN